MTGTTTPASGAEDATASTHGSPDAASTPAAADDPAPEVVLRALAPAYIPEQHSRYVRHLDHAVEDPTIRNIALTGRYGSGKSSVLDEFEARHRSETLRISINTLGPGEDDDDLTNRIQKELVKQLVYRARPGQVRRSRFARSAPLTWPRAVVQSVLFTVVGLALLRLLGAWPTLTRLGDVPGPVTTSVFVVLVGIVALAARWLVGNRIVSQFTTAGTAVTLGEKPDTYFDKFLDEIMAFFDAVHPRYVIFEDLDRFDDPQIFDSLRELNTLINSSAGRTPSGSPISRALGWGWRGLLNGVNLVTLKKITKPRFKKALTRAAPREEPIRFIYAIKDSLFERIGLEPTKQSPGADDPRSDLAASAVERANRTKFFELVIPVVPFISHRNARDILVKTVENMGLSTEPVSRPLLDLVARHTTDMRLMINICNEFAVFAEHLLLVPSAAPGMTADHLFALVAYKNFHLADFEAIAQRSSSLDTLEQHHRALVRKSIENLQAKKRRLHNENELQKTQDEIARTMGERLIAYKNSLANPNGYGYQNFVVSGQSYDFNVAGHASFWRQVATEGSIAVRSSYGSSVVLSRDALTAIFPEAMDPILWRTPSATDWYREQVQADRDIAFLRGADFHDLAARSEFVGDEGTFDEKVTATLKSELARELVRRGFINRNFSEYSATFYGSFVGVDVAFFYNHSVQPNQMYVDYEFESEASVANLLEQVSDDDFAGTVSALNIQVVDYLLRHNVPAARRVAAFIASDFAHDATTFLDAFLNEASVPRSDLIGLLAAHPWREVFQYLAQDERIPDEDTRIELLDAALLSARAISDYALDASTRTLLRRSHHRLSALTCDQPDDRTKTIFAFAEDADLVIADLSTLGAPLRTLVRASNRYQLTAHNLRVALGIAPDWDEFGSEEVAPLFAPDSPTIERVRSDDRVWGYCRANIDLYIDAINDDPHTEFAVITPDGLAGVMNEQHEDWNNEQRRALVHMTSPGSALPDLTSVPAETWPMLLDATRVVLTVANVWAYAAKNGVDATMARALAPEGTAIDLVPDDVDIDTTTELAARILSSQALSTTARVRLVDGLRLPEPIDAADLTPTEDDLLARALDAGLVRDSQETFKHFVASGWEAVAAGFAASNNIESFLTPDLVAGVAADLIGDERVPDGIRRKVVNELADYVPDDSDKPALRAAGEYARTRMKLDLSQVQRVAQATRDPELVTSLLNRHRTLTDTEIVETLILLGPPYDELGHGPGYEFDLPAGSSTKTIFERLERLGRVDIVDKGRRRGKRVRNRT